MGWKGIAIGSFLGGGLGGPLGAVFGALFGHRFEERFISGRKRTSRRRTSPVRRSQAITDYDILGAKPTDTPEELHRKYRQLAKKYHPDAARAKGLSPSAQAKSAERMARINDAWARLRSARGI